MFNIISRKRCMKCGETKPLFEFHKDGRSKDSFSTCCEQCYKTNRRRQKREYQEEYRARNPEKVRAAIREWYYKNTDRARELGKIWFSNNIEKKRESSRKYVRNHPEKSLMNRHRYMAKKKANGGVLTVQEWDDLKRKYNYTCLCCGQREPEIKITIDHVIPIAKGGVNVVENIQPLCDRCNKRKGAKVIDYR